MEIRVLRYFLAVVREGGINRAAEALHITQPTLSRQLAQLEEETGVRLFHRGSRKITLTNEGMAYSPAIEGSAPFWGKEKIACRPLCPELRANSVYVCSRSVWRHLCL